MVQQAPTDRSTVNVCEAEYMAICDAAKESRWLSQLLKELGQDLGPNMTVNLNNDNRGAVALASDSRFHKRTKHIDIRYHFIRELITSGQLKIGWLATTEMIADILTKAVSRQQLIKQRDLFMG